MEKVGRRVHQSDVVRELYLFFAGFEGGRVHKPRNAGSFKEPEEARKWILLELTGRNAILLVALISIL